MEQKPNEWTCKICNDDVTMDCVCGRRERAPVEKPKWEEEFESLSSNPLYKTQILPSELQSKHGVSIQVCIPKSEIKDFISSLLQRQKEEILRKIDDLGKELPTAYTGNMSSGAMIALSNVIKVIQDLEV